MVYPPSRCPRCRRPLRPWDNIPLLSWLWLRGRCRYCRVAIPKRYPLVEALTGGLFLATFWLFGATWLTLAHWIFLSWLVALSFIDLDTLTLPDELTQSGLVLGLIAQGLIGLAAAGSLPAAVTTTLGGVWGAVLGIWLFDLITIAASVAMGQVAMGGGDAKLAAMIGAWLGWQGVLLSGFLACFLGAVGGISGMALGCIHRRQAIPFGPFLAVGAAITVFWGPILIEAYLQFFFPSPQVLSLP